LIDDSGHHLPRRREQLRAAELGGLAGAAGQDCRVARALSPRSPGGIVTEATPQVEISGLSKTFKRRHGAGEVKPIDDVSLQVARGELVVLLGPSGCGKTTLLRSVAGLERPDAGRVRIQGQDVFNASKSLFVPPNRRPISMIFQSYALWPHMTVHQN